MSIHLFTEVAEHAYWRGRKEQELRRPQRAGEFFQSLPVEVRERLANMKSDEFKNVRWDAISWMCH